MPKAKKAKAVNVLKAASAVKIQGVSRKNNINVGQVTTAFKKVNVRTATARRALTALRKTINSNVKNQAMKDSLLSQINKISKELRPTGKYAITNRKNNAKLRGIYNDISNFSGELSRNTLKSDFVLTKTLKGFGFELVSNKVNPKTGEPDVIKSMEKIKDVGQKLTQGARVIAAVPPEISEDEDGNRVETTIGGFLTAEERRWIENSSFLSWLEDSPDTLNGEHNRPMQALLKAFPSISNRKVRKTIKTTNTETGEVTTKRITQSIGVSEDAIEHKIKQIYGLTI